MDAPKPILGVEQIQEELATLVSNNFKAVGIATGLVTTPALSILTGAKTFSVASTGANTADVVLYNQIGQTSFAIMRGTAVFLGGEWDVTVTP